MKLEIRWHLGTGDAIIYRGLFKHLLKRFDPSEVCVPATAASVGTVQHLFGHEAKGRQLRIRLVDAPEELYRAPFWPDSFKVTVGAAAPGFVYPRWDWSFYEQSGVDPAERFLAWQDMNDLPADVWDKKHNQKAFLTAQRRTGRKLVVFHTTREKRIPQAARMQYAGRLDWKVVEVTPLLGPSLLSWIPIFVDADAIHMVDSGPVNLANSLPLKPGCKLTIYGQKTPPPSMLNPGNQTEVIYGSWKPTL